MTEHALTRTDIEVRDILKAVLVMTRQALEPQPPGVYSRLVWYCYGGKWGAHPPGGVSGECWSGRCPLGAVGDLVYVREAWQEVRSWEGDGKGVAKRPRYRASDPNMNTRQPWQWMPADEMPEHRARIWLRVDEVRVERVDGVWTWARKCSVASTTGRLS